MKDITDCLIHSFHFIPKYDWEKVDESLPDSDIENWKITNFTGIYFSSDKTKDSKLYYIEFNNYLKMIDKVIKDVIVSVEYENGEVKKKSSQHKKS